MAESVDLRPGIGALIARRRIGHWTPTYLYYRLQSLRHARRHPDAPWLTADATRLLATWLHPSDVGAEWGAGNSTGWFGRRTARLTSFETNPDYMARVQQELRRLRIDNVDCQYLEDPTHGAGAADEPRVHHSPWVRAVDRFAEGSLDYALVDSAARGCVAVAVMPKLKSGGLLVVDNANWYLPPPADVRPHAPGTTTLHLGAPASNDVSRECWSRFETATAGWRRAWTSDGVSMTLLLWKRD